MNKIIVRLEFYSSTSREVYHNGAPLNSCVQHCSGVSEDLGELLFGSP